MNRVYDAKGLDGLLASVAQTHPKRFAEIQHNVANIGRNATYRRGDTVTLKDLAPVIDRESLYKQLDAETAAAKKQYGNDRQGFERAREEIYTRYSTLAEKQTMSTFGKHNNAVVTAVASGSRGKPAQVKAMLSTPGVYTDSNGRLIPVFIRNSYSDGLRPGEFLAGTFGARQSVSSAKTATAKGGELLKLAAATTINQVITENDCGADTGIAFDMEDPNHLEYRVLSKEVAGFPAGTYVDKKVLGAIKAAKPDLVVVRSATTCQSPKGLCAKCAGGFGTSGKLPKIGDHVGITAAQSLFEPVVQSALSTKHCLRVGTLVRMADDSTKKIEDVKPGEYVLGSDMRGNVFPVLVLGNLNQGIQQVYRFFFVPYDRESEPLYLDSTDCHPVLSHKEGDDYAEKIPVGETCKGLAAVLPSHLRKPGDAFARAPKLGSMFVGDIQCYDLSVDHPDQLFVLANGLIVKNTAGITGTKKSFSGLSALSQFLQSPDNMEYRAAVADEEGTVDKIEAAAQGGNYIHVGEKQYYVKPGYDVLVKPGDVLEAGDQLGDGIIDARDVVRTRGLGEGRKHYALQLAKILTDSGADARPQQTELLARGALDHMNIDDEDGIGGNLPDDIVTYNSIRSAFTSDDEKETSPDDALGKYLTKDVVHYTIGTKLTPKMITHLKANKVESVLSSPTQPGFTPTMPRLRTAAHSQDDWLAVLGTNYLSRNMQDALTRGADTNVESNVNFIPRLAIGQDFGKNVRTTGKF